MREIQDGAAMAEKGTFDGKVVTVIVLSYNNLDRIHRALDSILAQDYSDIEIIVADDGSRKFDEAVITNRIGTRNRGNIKRYEIVRSESNRGTVANLYEALLHFTGDYYITMGADDELFAETTLSDYMHVFKEQYYEPYLVVGNMAMYDGYMEKFQRAYLDKAAYDLMKTRDVEKIFGWLSHTCFIPTVATCYSRRFLEEVGMPDRDFRFSEDWTTFFRMAEHGITPEPLEKFTAKHAAGGIANGNTGGKTDFYRMYQKDKEKMWDRYVRPHMNRLSERDRALFQRRMKFERDRYLLFTDFAEAPRLKKLRIRLAHPSLVRRLLGMGKTDGAHRKDLIFALLSAAVLILLWNMSGIAPFYDIALKIVLIGMGGVCMIKFIVQAGLGLTRSSRQKKGVDLY